MSKLDRFPRFSNAKSKTLHDMSYDFKFTCAAGHLNPVNTDILLPGDKIDFQPVFQVRCAQPLLAAAMADIDFHVETFFVPMTMLWTPFEDFIYGVNGNYSSSYSKANKLNLPLLNMQEMMSILGGSAAAGAIYLNTSFDGVGQSYVRLATLLGLNPNISSRTAIASVRPFSDNYKHGGAVQRIFPWQILAYNCIFQNYYRLDDYTEFRQATFNVDRATANGIIQLSSTQEDCPGDLACKYRPAYKDYFTSIKKSPLLNEKNLLSALNRNNQNGLLSAYGDLGYQQLAALYNPSGFPFANDDFVNNVNFANSSPTSVGNMAVVSAGQDISSASNGLGSGGSYQSTAQLRALFANEKLLMVTARARKNYDAQTLAHFGVNVPHDVKHEITLIGSDSFRLSINELVSTAATDKAALGEYYGKGLAGKATKRLKFTAPCHGVLMTIFSCAPHYDYIVDFMKKNNIQNRLQFFQPEYDALGMQPIYRYEVARISPYTLYDEFTADGISKDWYYDIQGWQYRYEEFKRNFNRATVAFDRDVPNDESSVYSSWALTRRPYMFNSLWKGYGYSQVNSSSIISSDYYAGKGVELYINPHDLDQLFAGSYFTGWKAGDASLEDSENWNDQLWNVFARDPFVVNSRFNYKKFSIMSTYSMPKLD